jgi:hypothetical protein
MACFDRRWLAWRASRQASMDMERHDVHASKHQGPWAREKPLLVLIYSRTLTGCWSPCIPDISSSFGNHCEFGRLGGIVWATLWHYGGGASEGNKPTQPAWYVPEASHPVGVFFLVTFWGITLLLGTPFSQIGPMRSSITPY